MKASDFKYDATKQFAEDTSSVEEFDPYQYTKIDEEHESETVKTKEDKEATTVPLKITSFPWNPRFEGLVFQIGKIDIQENEDESANLTYQYKIISNPNDLELVEEDDEQSRDNEVNELMDVFVGRLIESLLWKMSQDKDFLEQVNLSSDSETKETIIDEETNETESE